jgi:hypothetical protein
VPDFSDEHIWPDALGGDHLPPFWRTDSVCRTCNSTSGVFVDGAFIRGWAGSAERGSGAREYMSLTDPGRTVLPLDHLGRLSEAATKVGEVADWWAGPCGAHIVHFRPAETEDLWRTYLGGDPRAKKSRAGRAYIALASGEPFWVVAALASFLKHFKRAARYVVTPGLPAEWTDFKQVDRSDPDQAADLLIVDSLNEAAEAGRMVPAQLVIQVDAGNRLLAKLGLAVGCKLFGADFGEHEQGAMLRHYFREAKAEQRATIPLRGTGYFGDTAASPLDVLTWAGGWVLILQVIDGTLSLAIITPSGRRMAVMITDDPSLVGMLEADYDEGIAWITIPSLGRALGPLPLPEYLAHVTRSIPNPELSAVEAARIDPSKLPPCREEEVANEDASAAPRTD